MKFNNLVEGVTYREEVDEQTGFTEIVIKENRDKKMIPTISVNDKSGEEIKSYNLFRKFILNNKRFLGLINSHDKLIYAFYRYNDLKWIISANSKIFYRQTMHHTKGLLFV